MSSGARVRVAVLGGGPDAERQVSLTSAKYVAQALRESSGSGAGGSGGPTGNRFDVASHTIDLLTPAQLKAIEADVLVPVLHGGWGEGGPLQDLLEADGRPFVFSGSRASRLAMDKLATKFVAMQAGIPTKMSCVLDLRDERCPLEFPVIVKPIHEGSTIGLYVVKDQRTWEQALTRIRAEADTGAALVRKRCSMIEPMVTAGGQRARELTVGVLDGKALPIIEIVPADGLYDYEAKYTRNDTQYLLDPALPSGVESAVKRQSEALFKALGCRHVARTDFLLDDANVAWLLEINTIPGFTDHSLVPKAAAHAGIPMPELCARLVDMAVRDGSIERGR